MRSRFRKNYLLHDIENKRDWKKQRVIYLTLKYSLYQMVDSLTKVDIGSNAVRVLIFFVKFSLSAQAYRRNTPRLEFKKGCLFQNLRL